jgi:hydrogenase expression/formation protein HypC
MCLTIPMRVEEIDRTRARCAAFGQETWADLALLAPDLPAPGDYVLVSLGFAQRIVPEAEALKTWALWDEINAKTGGM